MVAKKKAAKKIKSLPTKTLSSKKAKTVKGGAFKNFANFGDIKGESMDDKHKDWIT